MPQPAQQQTATTRRTQWKCGSQSHGADQEQLQQKTGAPECEQTRCLLGKQRCKRTRTGVRTRRQRSGTRGRGEQEVLLPTLATNRATHRRGQNRQQKVGDRHGNPRRE